MGGAGEGTRVTADDPNQEAPDTAAASEPDRLQVLRDALEKSPEAPADESVARQMSAIGPTLQNRILGSRLASNNLLRLQNTLAASPAFQVGEQVQRAISGSVVSTMPFRNLIDDNVSRTTAAPLGRQSAVLGFGTPSFKSLIDDSVATTAAAISRQAYAGVGFGGTAPTFKDLLEIDPQLHTVSASSPPFLP